MISLSEAHAGIWDLHFKVWNPKIPEILSECGHGNSFENNWEKGKKMEKWSICSNRSFKKKIFKTQMSREIAKEFLLSLKATKKKEAVTPQRARGVKMVQLNAQPCPGFYAQISQTPHNRQEYISGSRAVLLSKYECRQQGEAFLERRVRKLFCLLLLLLGFLKPLQEEIGKENWRKTGFCPCRTVAQGHTCRVQESRLTHKQAIKLLSLSRLVIAELEGLTLILFLEDGFNSLHKPHHFTQDAVLQQVKLYKCQVPGTSTFLDPLTCSESSSPFW